MPTATMPTVKKRTLLKSVKNGVKKVITTNDEGNYVISKINISTNELITSTILNSEVFEINEVVDYFSKY
jgi:hypothetical protein